MASPQYLFLIDGQFAMCQVFLQCNASQVFFIFIYNFHVWALCSVHVSASGFNQTDFNMWVDCQNSNKTVTFNNSDIFYGRFKLFLKFLSSLRRFFGWACKYTNQFSKWKGSTWVKTIAYSMTLSLDLSTLSCILWSYLYCAWTGTRWVPVSILTCIFVQDRIIALWK